MYLFFLDNPPKIQCNYCNDYFEQKDYGEHHANCGSKRYLNLQKTLDFNFNASL